MKFKVKAIPDPSKGVSFVGVKDECVPDQSMSLLEILTRFTRGETLPVGKDAVYHESEDDLEKVAHMDLVDKEEFRDKLEETKKAFDRQEKAKG